jgi:UPF0755 protein
MSSKKKVLLIIFIIITAVIFFVVAFSVNYFLNASNIDIGDNEETYIYVYDGDTFDDVLAQLRERQLLKNEFSFVKMANFMGYPKSVKSGKYKIDNTMGNLTLIRHLRAGRQTPTRITFNNIRTKEELSARLGEQLMIDSLQIINVLEDTKFLAKYGLNNYTSIVVFIPNTYEVYWNISATALFEKMWKEYNRFWNNTRKEKAEKAGFSPLEISIIASIVEEETNYAKEKPTVAGLYINRLRRNLPLQADPTVKFAVGDFSIRRVLNKHLEFDSPYNTYIYKGLPPGPIRIPSIESIDAVLNYEKHNYIYMCAKYDEPWKHAFAVSFQEHQRNAAKFRRSLNQRKIFK